MGAAHGVGLACAHALAGRGSDVYLSDIDGAALNRAAKQVGGTGIFCDIASEASVAVFAAEVKRRLAAPDLLINAAGRSYVRALGTMRITRALLPLMKSGERRKDIVNVAYSGAADELFPYAASLEAYGTLADALTDEIRGTSIVLTTVMPRTISSEGITRLAAPDNEPRRRLFYCDLAEHEAIAGRIADTLFPSGNRPSLDRSRVAARR